MKPLTIEQLKSLEVGDWVWIARTEPTDKRSRYYSISDTTGNRLLVRGYDLLAFLYSDYGTKWLAYKNKEQAECKGEIVELLCRVGDTVYIPWVWDGESDVAMCPVHCIVTKDDGEDFWICVDLETDDFGFDDKYRSHLMSDCGKTWFTDKAEAERRLAELTKE